MGNLKLIKCDNSKCDFWQDGNCLYGGTQEVKPDVNQEDQCRAFEPFCEEDNY